MIRRPPRSTLFPYTSSSDLRPRVLHYVLRRRVGTNESPRKAHHCRMEASDQAEERALVSGAERLDQRRVLRERLELGRSGGHREPPFRKGVRRAATALHACNACALRA